LASQIELLKKINKIAALSGSVNGRGIMLEMDANASLFNTIIRPYL